MRSGYILWPFLIHRLLLLPNNASVPYYDLLLFRSVGGADVVLPANSLGPNVLFMHAPIAHTFTNSADILKMFRVIYVLPIFSWQFFFAVVSVRMIGRAGLCFVCAALFLCHSNGKSWFAVIYLLLFCFQWVAVLVGRCVLRRADHSLLDTLVNRHRNRIIKTINAESKLRSMNTKCESIGCVPIKMVLWGAPPEREDACDAVGAFYVWWERCDAA